MAPQERPRGSGKGREHGDDGGAGEERGGSGPGGSAGGRRRAARDRSPEAPKSWGGLARQGTGRMFEGPKDPEDDARRLADFREREARREERRRADVERAEEKRQRRLRSEAGDAVTRAERPRAKKPTRSKPVRRPNLEDLAPVITEAHDEALGRAVGAVGATRIRSIVEEASQALGRNRFADVRRLLRPVTREVPGFAPAREQLGLAYYRLDQWRPAAEQLEAFRTLTARTDQHPVLADCYRALGRHREVGQLWEELGAASPSAALVTEGRIVLAGSQADQGEVSRAIATLEAGPKTPTKPRPHHLRLGYALADLYERAGDVAGARDLFAWVAAHDPKMADAGARAESLT